MFTVINPQPKASDISFWEMVYSDHHKSYGLVFPKNDPMTSEFIKLPADIDPTGIKVIKRNNLWFWVRPEYYNLSDPKEKVIETLTPFSLFDDRQMRLVSNCLNYQHNDPAGLGCHNVNLLVAKLFTLLHLTLRYIDPDDIAKIAENYKAISGESDMIDLNTRIKAGFYRRRVTVGQMKDILDKLDDSDLLSPNRAGNLNVLRQDEEIGYIDFNEGSFKDYRLGGRV